MSAETKPNCILGNGYCPSYCELIKTAKRLTKEQQEGSNFIESVAPYQTPEVASMCAKEKKLSGRIIQRTPKQTP